MLHPTQVALWLTRTSTQDIYQEFTMSSLKNLMNPPTNPSKYAILLYTASTVSYIAILLYCYMYSKVEACNAFWPKSVFFFT